MIDAEKLAEWKRLAEAATPGPWRVGIYGHDHADDEFDGVDSWCVEAGKPDDEGRWVAAFMAFVKPVRAKVTTKADADFCAAAREAMPALLAEVDRLRAWETKAREALEHARECYEGAHQSACIRAVLAEKP